VSFLPDRLDDPDDEEFDGEERPKTWRVEVSQTLTGVIIIDARGYGIATEEEAKEQALSQLSEGDFKGWEGGSHDVTKITPIGSPCAKKHEYRPGAAWCDTHNDPIPFGTDGQRKSCYERTSFIENRWRDRKERRQRAADRAFRLVHHQTQGDYETVAERGWSTWKCANCDARGADEFMTGMATRKAHEQVPL
jgi:hypothetical protein